ncbi:hypothetical protein BDW02DRAFT_508279 [Decorospora gaudefroyi]|uniref:Uncharacterized protein n=1 Tax=Decorospora gaudefroyi TaxID=184978 RepID=A0A6A5K1L0_9PLEO|nr:hypothetical protein BDW02DRAFT_508279 [Decorospora gaudefroyi]
MAASTATTPRTSLEMTKSPVTSSSASIGSSQDTLKKPSGKARSLWTSVKRHAKEHHEGMNAAYATYYGQSQAGRGQEVWEYRR